MESLLNNKDAARPLGSKINAAAAPTRRAEKLLDKAHAGHEKVPRKVDQGQGTHEQHIAIIRSQMTESSHKCRRQAAAPKQAEEWNTEIGNLELASMLKEVLGAAENAWTRASPMQVRPNRRPTRPADAPLNPVHFDGPAREVVATLALTPIEKTKRPIFMCEQSFELGEKRNSSHPVSSRQPRSRDAEGCK